MLPLVVFIIRDWPPHISAEARSQEEAASGIAWSDYAIFLRDPKFWCMVVYNCGALIYLWGLNSWLPTYLQRVRHFDIQHLGIYSSLPFVFLFVGELLSGYAADKSGRKAIFCCIGLAGAAVTLYLATVASDATLAALLIAVSSGSFGLAVPANYALVQRIIPARVLSTGTGVYNGIANTVGALAPVVMGVVIDATNNFNAGLMVLVAGCLCGAAGIFPLVRKY